MEGGTGGGHRSQSQLHPSTQRGSVQGLQALPRAPQAALEDPASGVAEVYSGSPVEAGRGSLNTERGKLNQAGAVQIDLVAQC